MIIFAQNIVYNYAIGFGKYQFTFNVKLDTTFLLLKICAIKIPILSIAIQVCYQIGLNEKKIEYKIFPMYFKKRKLKKVICFRYA